MKQRKTKIGKMCSRKICISFFIIYLFMCLFVYLLVHLFNLTCPANFSHGGGGGGVLRN